MMIIRPVFLIILLVASFQATTFAAPVSEAALLRACPVQKSHPFIEFNHYCYGVRKMYNAGKLFKKPKERRYVLQEALSDFDYVLRRVPVNAGNQRHAPIIALTNIHKARTLVMLRRSEEAFVSYAEAIRIDPLQPKAYAGLSDLYREKGMKKLAKEIIEDGLKLLPESKILLRRKKRLLRK